MQLSRKQFDILSTLAIAKTSYTQRQLSYLTRYSLGSVNKGISELLDLNLIDQNEHVTELGFELLEPYRVKKAVFLAAGFGSRMVPITLNTPKPLVRVNGERIIDSMLDAVIAIGISDITIVRGYLSEQFDQLKYKYPMIKFIENPAYNESNNISSALVARYEFQNAYVLESDLLIKNPTIFKKYHYSSDFLCIQKERSDDWCFTVKNGLVSEEKFGGLNCHQMVGISYWNSDDGAKLANHIKLAYEQPGGKERFWEQVPLSVFSKDYSVHALPCQEGDVIELDTFRELKAIDQTYDVK